MYGILKDSHSVRAEESLRVEEGELNLGQQAADTRKLEHKSVEGLHLLYEELTRESIREMGIGW